MRTALITGASEGIGREFARSLASKGFSITAVARNEARLQDLLAEIGPARHSYMVADLSVESEIVLVKELLTRQHFDLVINNAGFGIYGAFENSDMGKLTAMMRLNCAAVVEISQSYLKTARPGDALINVSSTASRLPMPMASVYAATKAFVTGFSESVWYEQRKKDVYVMCLCPGMTSTKFHNRAGGKDEQIPSVMTQTPAQVVKRALKALQQRKSPIVLCGPQRPLIFLSRFIPRRWVIWLAGKTLDWGLSR